MNRSRLALISAAAMLSATAAVFAPGPLATSATGSSADAAVLNAYGQISLASGAQLQTATWNWSIARGAVLIPGSGKGYLLDGFGGVHPFGGAPAVSGASYWPNWDIARAIALNPCDATGGSGYVLDGYGGVHPFGGAPAIDVSAYWPNWDIARGFALNSCSAGYPNGYVLDGYGWLHPFWQIGKAPIAGETSGSYWRGFDIARGVVITSDGMGEVLDGYGGIHPFNGGSALAASAYWPGWDIARGIAYDSGLGGGYVLDGYGNLHAYGSAPALTPKQINWGQNLAAGVAIYSGTANVANVFVAANGSDSGGNCARMASPRTNPDPGGSTLCASFEQAYKIALPGDKVEVETGNYGPQTILKGSQSQAGPVMYFECAIQHGCVINGDLSLGYNSSVSTASPSYLTFDGFDVSQGCFVTISPGLNQPQPTRITFTNGHIWQTTVDTGCNLANLASVDHGTISNTELGPGCCAFDALEVSIPDDYFPNPSNITLDHLYVHDIYGSCSEMPAALVTQYGCSTTGFDDTAAFCGSNCDHVDGLQSFGCVTCSITNSTWYRAGAQALFLSSYRGTFSNITIENNLIGHQGTPYAKEGGCGAICIGYAGGAGGQHLSGTFNIIDNSTDDMSLNLGANSFLPGSQINLVGNIFFNHTYVGYNGGGFDSCNLTMSDGSTLIPNWAYNMMNDHTCSGTDIKGQPTYVNSSSAADDLHLATGSLGIDAIAVSYCNANPAFCPASDVDGQSRPRGTAYDIGADEY